MLTGIYNNIYIIKLIINIRYNILYIGIPVKQERDGQFFIYISVKMGNIGIIYFMNEKSIDK